MKLLFASAEIYPYAKTGGLADVVQALPRALSEKIEVCSVMPLYDFIDREVFNISPLDESFRITLGDTIHQITLYYGFNQGVETLFVYEPMLCGKSSPYGDDSGDYPDNDLRFGLFSKALVIVARLYAVDILHLNDWHTALAALWAREMLPDLRTVFTIHNLAFQGIFSRESMQRLGLDHSYFKSESIEFWEQVNYMKAGIAYSDIVTTVSPRYAQEILQPDFGFGLDGFLQAHSHKLFGILNGIDTLFFDPENDPALPHNYNSSSLQTKKLNKDILCEMRGFEQSSHPLFIFIGRFTHQKGLDIIAKALPDLLKMKLNLAIIGEGDRKIATELQSAAQHHKNFSVYFGYDETLSHQMYAAADFLLMPSSFEPCGLNQLIAMRYGTLPVVHRIGGLCDTIRDRGDKTSKICGQGISMKTFDSDGLIKAVRRASTLYKSTNSFEKTTKSNMQCDVSFEKSADEYLKRYIEI